MTPILLPFASQHPQTALAGVNLQRPWLQVLRSITFHKLRHDISLCSHAPIGNFPKEATVMTLWGQVEHYIQLWCTKMKVWDFNQLGDMFHLRLFGYTFCLALFLPYSHSQICWNPSLNSPPFWGDKHIIESVSQQWTPSCLYGKALDSIDFELDSLHSTCFLSKIWWLNHCLGV